MGSQVLLGLPPYLLTHACIPVCPGCSPVHCRYVLWDQPAWDEWRDGNFVRWLQQWEATAARYGCTAQRGWLLGTPAPTLADLATVHCAVH